MILEFSISNFRSFRDRQTFSMIPDDAKNEHENNIIEIGNKYRTLRSAVIYGANASGKSNFMRGLHTFRNLILHSADQTPDSELEAYDPFQFNPRTKEAPTVFEIDFILEKVRYNYQVSILKKEIIKERLLFFPEGRESRLFIRDKQVYTFGEYLKGQKTVVSKLTGKNQLFLSKAARNNIQQLIIVYNFFAKGFTPIPYLDTRIDSFYKDLIAQELINKKKDTLFINNFKRLLKSFDTGILDFKIEKSENYFIIDDFEVSVKHNLFDDSGKNVSSAYFPMEEESTGTQKLFVLGGLILRTLMTGRVIMIDEFERSLHPLISSYLIQLFNDPKINSRGAQLIIATHDTNLLSNSDFRRDQIWIVEKSKTGASELYALSDMKGILKEAPYEKWYLSGRLGGIPGIKSLDFDLNYTTHEKN